MTSSTVGVPADATGLTTTSVGGGTHTVTMNNGAQYSVRQEDWCVKADYYLDTFVYCLPDVVRQLRRTGNKLSRILEIGVARGVLSIGLALLTDRDTHIVGIDIEERAKALVAENAAANNVAERIEVRIGDLCSPLGDGEAFDLIIGELPFIPLDPTLEQKYVREGRASEIRNVSGGADGRYLLDRMITEGSGHLTVSGALVLIQPSFIGVERTLSLMDAKGLVGEVLVSREWRLADTKFTRDSRDYIEHLNPSAFPENVEGDAVFHLMVMLGVKQ